MNGADPPYKAAYGEEHGEEAAGMDTAVLVAACWEACLADSGGCRWLDVA